MKVHHRFITEDDWNRPLTIEVQTNHGPQPWHEEARRLRSCGWSIRKISKALGMGFGSVQRLLNPESKAKAKKQQSKSAKERRQNDPEYAEKIRSYNRRYAQLAANGRAKS